MRYGEAIGCGSRADHRGSLLSHPAGVIDNLRLDKSVHLPGFCWGSRGREKWLTWEASTRSQPRGASLFSTDTDGKSSIGVSMTALPFDSGVGGGETICQIASCYPENSFGSSTCPETLTYYSPISPWGQTVLTYLNYSSQSVTGTTNFLADDGTPLPVPFGGDAASATRTDTLAPARRFICYPPPLRLPPADGRRRRLVAQSKASMLFRWYNQGAAITEAGVNASTTPTTKFAPLRPDSNY
jgi:hypothetical protein